MRRGGWGGLFVVQAGWLFSRQKLLSRGLTGRLVTQSTEHQIVGCVQSHYMIPRVRNEYSCIIALQNVPFCFGLANAECSKHDPPIIRILINFIIIITYHYCSVGIIGRRLLPVAEIKAWVSPTIKKNIIIIIYYHYCSDVGIILRHDSPTIIILIHYYRNYNN